MFEQSPIQHTIQRFIIGVLLRQEVARFRDLRPPKTDTNLFSYHLKVLIKGGWITKHDSGYTLTTKGLSYVDRVNLEKVAIRSQPKVITMLVVQNSEGDILVQKRPKQPYINAWTLPYGKIHIDDSSVLEAASREASEKLAITPVGLRHVGDCYIRVEKDSAILTTTLAHICRFESDNIMPTDSLMWVRPLDMKTYHLAPAVEAIVTRTFFGDDFFFAEFNEAWYD